jgi:hypothetical protein
MLTLVNWNWLLRNTETIVATIMNKTNNKIKAARKKNDFRGDDVGICERYRSSGLRTFGSIVN